MAAAWVVIAACMIMLAVSHAWLSFLILTVVGSISFVALGWVVDSEWFRTWCARRRS